MSGIVLVAVWTTLYPDWIRAPFGRRYFEVTLPTVEEGALVLLTQDEPLSYLAPFFPGGTRFVGALTNLTGPDHHNLLQQRIERTIAGHKGPIYVLRAHESQQAGEFEAIRHYGLQIDVAKCPRIRSNLDGDRIGLCTSERL